MRVPGSKSVTHRAFLLAAQSPTPCTVVRPLLGADTQATLACLAALGSRFQIETQAVRFLPSDLRPPAAPLDCRNSGTTLRLVTGLAARLPAPVTLTGDDSLQGRPNGLFLAALRALGAKVPEAADRAPYQVQGPIQAGTVQFPARVSSQYVSSLLLSLPMLPGTSTLHLTPPVASRPYLDVTLDVATRFGIQIDAAPDRSAFTVPGGQAPRADGFEVEGDWSTAAFPLVAGAVTGGRVIVSGVRRGSPQGDEAIVDHLRSFGCTVHQDDEAVTVDGGTLQSPGTVDVADTPDLFPILAVLAACSAGTTTFTGGAALRHKESDRIAAMAEGLSALGVAVAEAPDGLTVDGGSLRGAFVGSHHDHRVHMALAVAGLAAAGETVVDDPGCVAVSYPGFHDDLARLSGAVTVVRAKPPEVAAPAPGRKTP